MTQKQMDRLMTAIGIIGFVAFLNLFWICSFSLANVITIFPLFAIRVVWIPAFPFFILFFLIAHVGFKRQNSILSFLIWFTPILFIYGIFSQPEIKFGSLSQTGIVWMLKHHSFSEYIFTRCLLGFLEIGLSILIIIAWWLRKPQKQNSF